MDFQLWIKLTDDEIDITFATHGVKTILVTSFMNMIWLKQLWV